MACSVVLPVALTQQATPASVFQSAEDFLIVREGAVSLPVPETLIQRGFQVQQTLKSARKWNILGGYTGYVNFGTPAFFALGAYTAAFLMLFC